ncbi:MAG TPA: glycogen debranching N-terminal domain-containing protein, partial [Nannocystis sp.]
MNQASLEFEDPFQILAAASLTLTGARVLKYGDTFAVFDRIGDIRPMGVLGAQGLYHEGARFLSALRLRMSGEPLPLLGSAVSSDNIVFTVDMMNPDLRVGGEVVVPHGTLHVAREKFLWQATCYEHLQVGNHCPQSVSVDLEIEFAADFADLFEVRGTRRPRRGVLHLPEIDRDAVVLAYSGLDGRRRRTRIAFDPAPEVLTGERAVFRLHLAPRCVCDYFLTITCDFDDAPAAPRREFARARSAATAELRVGADDEACFIESSSEQLDAWIRRSLADLRMMTTRTPHGRFPHA